MCKTHKSILANQRVILKVNPEARCKINVYNSVLTSVIGHSGSNSSAF